MEHLETPAFLVFLHQMLLLALIGFLGSQGVSALQISNVSPAEMRAAVPAAVFEALQLMLFFATMNQAPAVLLVALALSFASILPSFTSYAALQAGPSLTATQKVRNLHAASAMRASRCSACIASHSRSMGMRDTL